MAWFMNAGGIGVSAPIPDRMVDYIKAELQKLQDPAKGIWVCVGDQGAEGSIQVYVTPSTPILFTRAPNDPSELLYAFEQGTAN